MEYRHIMILAHFAIAFNWTMTFLIVSRISKDVFGINDIVFSFFAEAAAYCLYVAFVGMPTLVLLTKIVPKNIEATIYSFFTSLQNLSIRFFCPMVGGIITDAFRITKDDFTNLSVVILIQIATSLIPIIFVCILPTNKEVDNYHEEVIKSNLETQQFLCHDEMEIHSSNDFLQSHTSEKGSPRMV